MINAIPGERMYIIIGSHFVPLEGKFLLITLVIVRMALNVIVRQVSAKRVSIVQKLVVKLSNKCLRVFWTMDTLLFSGHLGAFDALSHLMLSLQ